MALALSSLTIGIFFGLGLAVSEMINPARVIGCIVYPSAVISEPGVIEHIEGTRFSLGEPDGSKSDRCRRIAEPQRAVLISGGTPGVKS